jgi:hypothetical protein
MFLIMILTFKSKYKQNFKKENTTTMAKVVAMPPGIGQ